MSQSGAQGAEKDGGIGLESGRAQGVEGRRDHQGAERKSTDPAAGDEETAHMTAVPRAEGKNVPDEVDPAEETHPSM